MKTLFTLLVVSFAIAAHAQTLPDAPSVACARTVMCDDPIPNMAGHKWGDVLPKCLDPMFKGPVEFATTGPCEEPIRSETKVQNPGFWRGHPTRTKLIIAAIGGGIGLTVALVTRHNCPNFYWDHGKKEPYDGTPPCPGPDYDPGSNSAKVRWRF